MKTNTVFTHSFFRFSVLMLVLSVVFDSCSDQKLALQPTATNDQITPPSVDNSLQNRPSGFSKTVGAPIDKPTALRWTNNFVIKNKGIAMEYFIQASAMKTILSNSACVGISLHYAMDNTGKLHILPMGVDANGNSIQTNNVATDSSAIDWATAQQWIANYTGEIKSHFFGSIALSRLLQQAQSIKVTFASDDSGSPQLLLNDTTNPNSETLDHSVQCPPFCS